MDVVYPCTENINLAYFGQQHSLSREGELSLGWLMSGVNFCQARNGFCRAATGIARSLMQPAVRSV